MGPKDASMVLLVVAMFATIAWVVYLAADTSRRQRRMKAQAELHGRLLDKFSSASEVVNFLETPGGARFVDNLSSDREEPANGILRSAHRGIVLIVVGAGCLGLIRAYGWENNPLLVIGVILLCLGIGFLISAAVSHRLSKALGMRDHSGNLQQ